jgi:hypothetical protein
MSDETTLNDLLAECAAKTAVAVLKAAELAVALAEAQAACQAADDCLEATAEVPLMPDGSELNVQRQQQREKKRMARLTTLLTATQQFMAESAR